MELRPDFVQQHSLLQDKITEIKQLGESHEKDLQEAQDKLKTLIDKRAISKTVIDEIQNAEDIGPTKHVTFVPEFYSSATYVVTDSMCLENDDNE